VITAAAFETVRGDQINTDPMLGPLQDNFRPTYGLLTGSPAIDMGDPNRRPRHFPKYSVVPAMMSAGRIDVENLIQVQPVSTPTPAPPHL
jgi:hypothetical protein